MASRLANAQRAGREGSGHAASGTQKERSRTSAADGSVAYMQAALVASMIFSTALFTAWLALLFASGRQERLSAAYAKLFSGALRIASLKEKDRRTAAELSACSGPELAIMKLAKGGTHEKEIAKIERLNNAISNGDIGKAGIAALPGHVIRNRVPAVGRGALYKKMQIRHIELYGKKNAEHKTNGALASMLSYAIVGVAATLAFGTLLAALELGIVGPTLMAAGPVFALAAAYSIYDEPRAKAAKRRDAIARQFPNVVSKLALLVCSGMIMDRAWNETARSNSGELYAEMRKTAEELMQNISPEAAYSDFIVRCNTKETSKLASAILQNLSKGNAEIGSLLRELAREAWQERRHTAKRDAEAANSKLLIPTMLLFISILLMIGAPIMMTMGGPMPG